MAVKALQISFDLLVLVLRVLLGSLLVEGRLEEGLQGHPLLAHLQLRLRLIELIESLLVLMLVQITEEVQAQLVLPLLVGLLNPFLLLDGLPLDVLEHALVVPPRQLQQTHLSEPPLVVLPCLHVELLHRLLYTLFLAFIAAFLFLSLQLLQFLVAQALLDYLLHRGTQGRKRALEFHQLRQTELTLQFIFAPIIKSNLRLLLFFKKLLDSVHLAYVRAGLALLDALLLRLASFGILVPVGKERRGNRAHIGGLYLQSLLAFEPLHL